MDDCEAFALGIAVGQVNNLLEKLDPHGTICVTSDLFEDSYLSDRYDEGLVLVGAEISEWANDDRPSQDVVDSGDPQTDLFQGGPGHSSNPTEDGVYLIAVNGTPGLYSRFVSTMGWSHPTAVRRDLERATLPFIGWPYWNWEKPE